MISDQVRVLPHRLWMLVTYPWRRRVDWELACGCSFRATAYGWLGVECLDHWLD